MRTRPGAGKHLWDVVSWAPAHIEDIHQAECHEHHLIGLRPSSPASSYPAGPGWAAGSRPASHGQVCRVGINCQTQQMPRSRAESLRRGLGELRRPPLAQTGVIASRPPTRPRDCRDHSHRALRLPPLTAPSGPCGWELGHLGAGVSEL